MTIDVDLNDRIEVTIASTSTPRNSACITAGDSKPVPDPPDLLTSVDALPGTKVEQWLRQDAGLGGVAPVNAFAQKSRRDAVPSLSTTSPSALLLSDRITVATDEEALGVLRGVAVHLVVHDVDLFMTACTSGVAGRAAPALSPGERVFSYAYSWDYCLVSDALGNAASGKNYFEVLNRSLHERNTTKPVRTAVYHTILAVRNLPGLPGGSRVFRGLSDSSVTALYIAGAMVYWTTFVSTSTDFMVALGFAGDAGIIFDITLNDPEGRSHGSINDMSAFGHGEEEVLLIPNLTFVVSRVVERSPEHGGRTAIHLVHVRDDTLVEY